VTENNNLSEREIETLKLVAQGMSNKQIALSLFISINTVKVHLRNIFEKINVESRTEATLYAIEHGIIPSPGPEFVPAPVVEPEISLSRKWSRNYWWLGIPLAFVIIVSLALFLSNSPIFRSPTPTPSFVQGVATVQRWTELAPMSVARASLAVAAYDNAIYAIGGDTAEGVTDLVERYDPQTDSWKTLKNKTTPVSAVSAAVIGGEIYVPGGKQADGSATNILEVYDPQRDIWQEKAPLPIPVFGYALASFEGRMYLFGGTDGSQFLDSMYIYDPQQDEWQHGSPMPTARAYAGAAEAGGKIYVIGGWDGEKAVEVNEVYVPDREQSGTQAWSVEAALPEPQYAFGMQGIGEIIFLVGKSTTEQYTLLQFLPQNGVWTTITDTPPNKLNPNLGVTTLQGLIYIFGGSLEDNILSPISMSYQAVYQTFIPVLQYGD
jgi:DNA-binding CsgD family transcriptional regulator